MPGRRCVVQDCGNVKNDELGISIHNSPDSGSVRLKWCPFIGRISTQWENLLCARSILQGIVLRLLFRWKAWKGIWRRGRFQPFGKNPLKHYQSGADDRWVKLQCICAVLITIIFISPFTCDMIFSGIVVQYSCNECSDYLNFPYCCMCFHSFLLSSHRPGSHYGHLVFW